MTTIPPSAYASWRDVLDRGGKLAGHPDTIRDLIRSVRDPEIWWIIVRLQAEERVVSSDLFEPGMLYALDIKAMEAERERWVGGGRIGIAKEVD